MPEFSYKARQRSGELVDGAVDAADRMSALQQIERMGLFPVSLQASKGGAKPTSDKASKATSFSFQSFLPPSLREFSQRQKRPKLKELTTFTAQLANLLHSGMPLTLALNSMSHLASKGIPSSVATQLKQEVMEGRSLSDAMARQPVVFSGLYVNMVRAGEQSGALEEVLRRLAVHFERFAKVQQKFVSSLAYPAIVAVVGVVIIFVFMTFMLPKFMSIFEGLDIPLPGATQFLMNMSHFFKNFWWLILAIIFAGWMLFKRFQASERGRFVIDGWKLNAPVFGRVMKMNLYGQFCRTLSTLLQNGVPVLTALKITEQIVPNVIVKEAIAKTREDVTDGKTIAQPLARSGLFPQLMIDLLRIGEDTGNVPGALENLADTYENELVVALGVLTNLIEPVLIIVMAIGVGFLLFSILSAMFSITSTIGR